MASKLDNIIIVSVLITILIVSFSCKNDELILEKEIETIEEIDSRDFIIGEYIGNYYQEDIGFETNYESIDTVYQKSYFVSKIDSLEIEISPKFGYFKNIYEYSDSISVYEDDGSHYSYIKYTFIPDSNKIHIDCHFFSGNGSDYDAQNVTFEGYKQ